jgi:hypothetical protein
MRDRYGSAFAVNIPIFGHAVVISDPALVKQLFTTSPEIVGNMEVNLGRVLGPGSLFSLEGEAHHRQRKLLVPPFHGRRLKAYEAIVEEETLREVASWPDEAEFATLPSMMRVTLNAILRAVFGADGAELEALRTLLPPLVELGSKLAALPIPRTDLGRFSPWGRFRLIRAEYDSIVDTLIAKAAPGPGLDERNDVLALMLQSTYDDGSAMSHSDIADQLLTLLTAGHETTATTLAWAIERLRRHRLLLRRLVDELDAGGSELLQATILEVQRARPVIDLTARQVKAPMMQLGDWVLPRGQTIMVSISLIHDDDAVFAEAGRFNPDRFVGVKPDLYEWVPFGGGTRRCIGAAFANMEMNVVLRSLLRDFDLVPTAEPDERWHSRGVAYAPAKGGRAIVRRRRAEQPARDTARTAAAGR